MTRRPTVTHKIEKAATGLRGALYIHVEHDAKGKVHRVMYSYKWKDDPELDHIFAALGDATTEAVREAQNGGPRR